ncbi:MAG: hypothetical protein JGK38_23940 [Microcoleus sp. PH2017_15_JOR_U_A]|uniref:hypothetical protein n=1 Tax=unclassified Microcoleus TaxID=2642155 RepID=UPI001DB1E329|nr:MULTISPECIES: hypothetical protein [unclassified Microcoleus]MCC3473311.1 hypothetical protein [Microcoleus sp. PH2017_13_LAR_U_A]MCC3486523.1 hypothetical protein [Microcoleus sp. PH2017_14_LAR_D_A]MCC3499609.1 hypothetical protein [Microcoleus sp. PH2017_15_JOR_U_A]MCC3600180.1 hypothetical protein [Microcoleus sp. PH2017_26_ELK_O_A]MCC3623165.1 hypothetical protein [Microcoleus sp. PH2017_36_ELK_O_B]
MNYYLIGIAAIGCSLVVGYYLLSSKRRREQEQQIKQFASKKKQLERENYDFRSETARNRVLINKLKDRIEALEHRQDRADEWFGSVIRHSRAQFDKEAVEKFIAEHGIQEEE